MGNDREYIKGEHEADDALHGYPAAPERARIDIFFIDEYHAN